jgi:hypothetical protein
MPDPAPYLLLGRVLPEDTITLDAWVDAFPPPAWAWQAIIILARTPGVMLRRVVVAPAGWRTSLRGNMLARPYEAVCRSACGFLRPVHAAGTAPAGTRVIPEGLTAESVIREDLSDIALYLGEQPLHGGCEGLARRYVWSIVAGDPLNGSVSPLFASEILGSSPVLTLCLVQHTKCWETGRILCCYQAPKFQSLYYPRAAEDPLFAVGALVARKIHDLLVFGPPIAEKEVPRDEVNIAPKLSSLQAASWIRYLAGRVAHSVASRTIHRSRSRRWFVAWRDEPRLSTVRNKVFVRSGFQVFRGRENLGYADPFPFHWGGKELLFMEEILPDERGRLVVTEIRDGKGSKEPPAVILDKPYHLSYPCVFEHRGDHFLIPESSANRTVDLYRATRFPCEWVLQKSLVQGMAFVDTTPVFHEGLWYFFVTTADPASVATESFLYYSDELDGPWKYHPSNPISSDVRRSRSAGRLFRMGETLIRPVQDCSLDYGLAIRLMAVERLTPDEYREREIAEIDSSWHPEAIRTHTLTFSEGLETIDGCRWVR